MARHRQRADLACRSVRRRCERSGRPRLIGEAQHLVRHRSHGAEQEQHGAARDRQRHQHIQRTGERHQRTTYQAARCRIARDEEYGGIRYRGGCDGEQHGAQARDQRGLRCEAPGIMQQQSGRHAGDGDAREDGHRRQAAIPAAKPIDHGDMAERRGDQQRLAEPRQGRQRGRDGNGDRDANAIPSQRRQIGEGREDQLEPRRGHQAVARQDDRHAEQRERHDGRSAPPCRQRRERQAGGHQASPVLPVWPVTSARSVAVRRGLVNRPLVVVAMSASAAAVRSR